MLRTCRSMEGVVECASARASMTGERMLVGEEERAEARASRKKEMRRRPRSSFETVLRTALAGDSRKNGVRQGQRGGRGRAGAERRERVRGDVRDVLRASSTLNARTAACALRWPPRGSSVLTTKFSLSKDRSSCRQ